jgi:hypothetical protein
MLGEIDENRAVPFAGSDYTKADLVEALTALLQSATRHRRLLAEWLRELDSIDEETFAFIYDTDVRVRIDE